MRQTAKLLASVLVVAFGFFSAIKAELVLPSIAAMGTASYLLGERRRLLGLLRYASVLLLIVAPVNLAILGPSLENLFLACLPILRIVVISLSFVLATSISEPHELLSALSRFLPRKASMAVALSLSMVPVLAEEIERIRLVQALRGSILLPLRKRIVLEVRNLALKSSLSAITRALRVAEALEVYF